MNKKLISVVDFDSQFIVYTMKLLMNNGFSIRVYNHDTSTIYFTDNEYPNTQMFLCLKEDSIVYKREEQVLLEIIRIKVITQIQRAISELNIQFMGLAIRLVSVQQQGSGVLTGMSIILKESATKESHTIDFYNLLIDQEVYSSGKIANIELLYVKIREHLKEFMLDTIWRSAKSDQNSYSLKQ